MDELDDYEGEDWKGWVAGKYDNRYGVRRHNDEYEYSYSTNTGSKKKKVSFVFVGLIACFCAISISGNLLLNSNDYLDVELAMMFYHNILTGIIYEGEIQKNLLSLDKEKIVAHIEDKGMLVKEKLKNKRIEDENLRIQETIEREKEELAKKQKIEGEYELLIFAYTNNERIKHGLNPLQLNERISNVARLHSEDMLKLAFFEHTNLRGQTPTDRGNSLGVSCVKNYGSYYTEGLSENIFNMEGYIVSNIAENSQTIVNGWMESQGHRENILGRDYDQIGIGVKFSNDEIYATQNFC